MAPQWQNEARETFWKDLKGKVREKAPPTEIQKFVDEWVYNTLVVELWEGKYRSLSKYSRVILLTCAASFLAGAAAIWDTTTVLFNLQGPVAPSNPTGLVPVHFLEISLAFFVVAGVAVFIYANIHQQVTGMISRYEIDPSPANLRKIIQQLVSERKQRTRT